MGTINLETKDYVLTSLDVAFHDDVVQAVCLRLNIHRGKYWADPNLGSRLYLLRRSKDVPRMLQIVKQYAEEGEFDENSKVVIIFPDHGSRYMSKVFSDDWMNEQGFFDSVNQEEALKIEIIK